MTTLEKIRAEIAELDDADYDYEGYYKAVTDALQIIDKYAEQEPCEDDYQTDMDEAWKQAKREPCDDAISREAVVDDFIEWREEIEYAFGEDYSGVHLLNFAIQKIWDMPSVRSQEPHQSGWEEMTVHCKHCGNDMTFKIAIIGEPCDKCKYFDGNSCQHYDYNVGYTQGYIDGVNQMDKELKAEENAISEDGTLTVRVVDGRKVSRVLVCGDNHWGGLYYLEEEPPVRPQEPCDDVVSRQAIKKLKRHNLAEGQFVSLYDIEQLPSVKQKSIECDDAISRQAVIDIVNNPLNIRLDEIIKKLPSVRPQEPKTGHWIYKEYYPTEKSILECSECGEEIEASKSYYDSCPVCGAIMVEQKVSEEKRMTDQWQELKETVIEMRDNDGTGTQQEVCKFLANYMAVLEKQMQEPKTEWIPITYRPMTDEEKKHYSEHSGYDEEDLDTMLNCLLPDDGETVLITDRLGNVEVDTFIYDVDGCYFECNCDMEDVIAWMPLPEPYKVEPQESSEKINCKVTKCENCQNHNYCDYEPQESEG